MSCKTALTTLREAIDAKLPEDQRCKKTIPQMTAAVESITVGGGGDIEFYECASYTPAADAYKKYFFTLTGADYSKVNGTYERKQWIEDFENNGDTEEYEVTAVLENENGCQLVEEAGYGEWYYTIYDASGDSIYGQDGPIASRRTDYNTIYWVDMSTWDYVTLTFSSWQFEDVPVVTEEWSGYKFNNTGDKGWIRSDALTTGLTVTGFVPEVGKIYSSDTSIFCHALFGEVTGQCVALYHFDTNATDATGTTTTTLTSKSVSSGKSKFGAKSLVGDTYDATQYDSSYYMEIKNLPELDAFTVEWWQYDTKNYGDGGVCMWQPKSGSLARSAFPTVPIPSSDKRYIYDRWKHFAFTREKGDVQVTMYLNGKKVGVVPFADKLGGRTVRFVGVSPNTGQAKSAYIDELAFFNYVKYRRDFDVPAEPYSI